MPKEIDPETFPTFFRCHPAQRWYSAPPAFGDAVRGLRDQTGVGDLGFGFGWFRRVRKMNARRAPDSTAPNTSTKVSKFFVD